jgi:hypothetical protein
MRGVWIFKESKQKTGTENSRNQYRPYVVQDLIDAYYGNAYHSSCINVKSICILGDGIEQEEVNGRLQEMVRGDSVFTLLQKTILDLRIFGDAFWEIVDIGGGKEIYYIPSWTMNIDKDGRWIQEVGGEQVVFDEGQIWHFKEPSMLSNIWGAPDYLAILDTIKLYQTITKYNVAYFQNNAIPDSILFIKGGDLGPATESGLRRFFREKFQGIENAAKFCVAPVPEEVEIQLERLQGEQKEGKFLELQNNAIMEIVSCHGVPPRLASIIVPGHLGGGGEAVGELKVFLNTRIKPLQNIFGGQLDAFFQEVMGIETDISFKPFDIMPDTAETALNLLRG